MRAADTYQDGFRDGAAFFLGWMVGRLALGSRDEIKTAEKMLHNWRVFRSDFLEHGASIVQEPRDG